MARSSRLVRGPARILSALLGLVFAFCAALFAVSTFDVLAPVRSSLVERLLGGVLGASVQIDGPVDFALGPIVRISGSGIRFEHPDGANVGGADEIDTGSVALSFQSLLSGKLDLTSLQLAGVRLADNSTLVEFRPGGIADDGVTRRWLGVIPTMVRLAQDTDIAVSDVRYRYSDEFGWDFDIVATSIRTGIDEKGQTTLDIAGEVNGKPVDFDGDIYSLDDDPDTKGNGFSLTVSTPGVKAELRSVVTTGPNPTVSAITVGADVASIGNLLDVLRIARTIEGTVKLDGSIDTTEATSSLRNLSTTITLADGPTIQLTGNIEDLDTQNGLDLLLDAQWPTDPDSVVDQAGLLAFDIYTVTARLSGELAALSMTDGWITTSIFSDALPRLGPISAGKIRRDEHGRIVVEDLRVLAGPTGDPTFDLTGRVGDLLQLSDFRLEGKVAMATPTLLGIQASDPEALGRLAGSFTVSDASGSAGIDTFAADIAGSDLISGKVSLTADQSQPTETADFALALTIPDYARFAAPLGLPAEPLGRIAFSGTASVSPQTGRIDGKLQFGSTTVSGDLSATPHGTHPLIAGRVTTPLLVIADARRLFEISHDFMALRHKSSLSKGAGTAPPPTHAKYQPAVIRPRFDIEIAAGRIEGAKSEVSGVSGRLLYDDGVATAKSVTLRFDGGHFGFDGHVNVRESGMPFSARGNIRRWPLGALFSVLDIDLPVQGIFEADFDVASSATSTKAAIGDAKGDLYMRIVDGVIGNRLIDLTGLVLPSWLLAPSARTGTSRIECLHAKLDFVPGRATLQSAVVQTDDVIVNATGVIDFRSDTMNIEATPRALRPNLVPIVSPFAIRGSLQSPKVVLEGGGAIARGVGEVLALPFNTLGTLLGVDRSGPKPRKAYGAC